MEVCLNEHKLRGFMLDRHNELCCPMFFGEENGLSEESKRFFMFLARHSFRKDKTSFHHTELERMLEKIDIPMASYVFAALIELERQGYIEIKDV